MASYAKPPERNGKVAHIEWRIAQAQERIAHQMAFIEYLGMTGHDTRHAITFLRAMEDTLAVMCRCRDLMRLPTRTGADEPNNGEGAAPLPYRVPADTAGRAPRRTGRTPTRQG